MKHNQLNVGRTALKRIAGALINCSLLQSGGGQPKRDKAVQEWASNNIRG